MFTLKKRYDRIISALENWAETWQGEDEENPIGLYRLIEKMKKCEPLTKHYQRLLYFHLWQSRYDIA
ncbi:MAG: hypothetical protein JRJ45_00105 [Deltaproteobacteria bacterium]|nr:hypothetical protein [Deltaproteobacteria bacterium]